MNVTSNGYYTSQYLKQHYDDNEEVDNHSNIKQQQVAHDSFLAASPSSTSMSRKGMSMEVKSPVITNIRPKKPIKSKSESFIIGSRPVSPKSPSSTLQVVYISDDDDLDEELTPAQLNYINLHYYIPPLRQGMIIPAPPKRSKKPRNKNDDYYINLQKRYDGAKVIKPKLYTHKTFHEVFVDKDEDISRYNPMDMVFEGSPEDNEKKKPIFKKIKLYKDDYNDYNYYDHREKANPAKDVFVQEVQSDDEVDEVLFGGAVLPEDEEQQKQAKKNNFKKLIKKKYQKAKKELGKDFDEFTRKQSIIDAQLKEVRAKEQAEKKAKAKEKKKRKNSKSSEGGAEGEKSIEGETPSEGGKKETTETKKAPKEGDNKKEEPKKKADPNPQEFSPMWNYILSWVAYQNEDNNNSSPPAAPPAKIEELSNEPDSKSTKSKRPTTKDSPDSNSKALIPTT